MFKEKVARTRDKAKAVKDKEGDLSGEATVETRLRKMVQSGVQVLSCMWGQEYSVECAVETMGLAHFQLLQQRQLGILGVKEKPDCKESSEVSQLVDVESIKNHYVWLQQTTRPLGRIWLMDHEFAAPVLEEILA